MTSYIHTKTKLPTHVMIHKRGYLRQDLIILLEQIRTIDKRRLKKYIGQIRPEDMEKVNQCLAVCVGLKLMHR